MYVCCSHAPTSVCNNSLIIIYWLYCIPQMKHYLPVLIGVVCRCREVDGGCVRELMWTKPLSSRGRGEFELCIDRLNLCTGSHVGLETRDLCAVSLCVLPDLEVSVRVREYLRCIWSPLWMQTTFAYPLVK